MGFRWGCQNQQRASAEQSMEGPTLRKAWWARTRVTAGLLGLEGYRVEERAVCEEQGMSPRVGKMLPLQRAEPPRALHALGEWDGEQKWGQRGVFHRCMPTAYFAAFFL